MNIQNWKPKWDLKSEWVREQLGRRPLSRKHQKPRWSKIRRSERWGCDVKTYYYYRYTSFNSVGEQPWIRNPFVKTIVFFFIAKMLKGFCFHLLLWSMNNRNMLIKILCNHYYNYNLYLYRVCHVVIRPADDSHINNPGFPNVQCKYICVH